MRQVALGDISVPAVGLGDVSLARAAARGVTAGEVARALEAALEAGLRVIDVSAGDADAARLAGDTVRALRLRDDALVACGIAAGDGVPPARAVQARVEDALRATRLDALPLALVPLRATWRATSPWPELVGTCARLVREGKVLRWGAELAALDEDTAELAREPWLCSVALPYSACERDGEPVIAAALEHGRAILARRPLAGGALAGVLGPGAPLAPRDERRALDLERFAVVAARLAPLTACEPAAARSSDAARQAREAGHRPANVEAQTLAELALRYALDRGVLALPRLHRAAHLPDALAALAAPPLSPELRARIEDAVS